MFTTGDKILIILLLVASIASIFFISTGVVEGASQSVIIDVEGQKPITITFNNEESKVYEFSFGKEKGEIEVANGKVRMLEMSEEICPQGICSKTGWIQSPYQTIVCLPNKIMVRLQKNEASDIDVMTNI